MINIYKVFHFPLWFTLAIRSKNCLSMLSQIPITENESESESGGQ